MRKNNIVAIAIALVGVAVAILAWLAAPERIDYEVKFLLVVIASLLLITAIGLPIWAVMFERKLRRLLNTLSGEISWAIHNLLNRPTGLGQTYDIRQLDPFAIELTNDFNAWCNRIDAILSNEAFFTQSDLLRFQRLGFIDPVHLTGHPDLDHTFSMLKLKLSRLQEVIDLSQQRLI